MFSDDDSSADTDDECSIGSNDDSFIDDSIVMSAFLAVRANRMYTALMDWHHYAKALVHQKLFHVKYRITFQSFIFWIFFIISCSCRRTM